MSDSKHPILQLRVALTTSDYERLVKFYCEGLGMEPAAQWSNDGGHALVLDMGKATLESKAVLAWARTDAGFAVTIIQWR